MDLNIIWFILIAVLFIGYAVLDGFDFGVGILHLFTKDEHEKRINLNAIGPVWDGNEVWLITGGGALFAAFPYVYATVFSGFYLALMLLLVALIFRAVSIEFRGKVDSPKWKKCWDRAFGVGSFLPALLFCVAYGNILRGIPMDQKGFFTGNFLTLLNPYALLIGILGVATCTMHGAIYMTLKSEGPQKERNKNYASRLWIAVVVLYILATVSTFFVSSFLFIGTLKNPFFWVLFILLIISMVYLPVALKENKSFRAMLSSSFMIIGMFGISAVSLFPKLVPSLTDLQYSLTIYNASSTQRTLSTMLIIALIGMPIVIIYTTYIYRVFKGKVEITKDSY